MSELDVIGALTGTDKSSSVSWGWDYLRHYEALVARWRHEAVNLIEIGVADGASLAAWERYFDQAVLVGIDVEPSCSRFERGRVHIRIGSQEDPAFLQRIAAEFPPTIVIDDGSHIAHHMIAAFEVLFPALAPGGVYIFEDMAFHFEDSPRQFQGAEHHLGLSDVHIYDYLSKFIRARAAYQDLPDKSWGFARYAFEHIDTMTVAGGMIAVRKKGRRSFDSDIVLFERYLAGARPADQVAMKRAYADFLIKHDTHLERAASLFRDVQAATPRDENGWNSLLHVLLRLKRLDEASEAANRQLSLNSENADYWDRLSSIERMRDRPELEIKAMQRLTELRPSGAVYHLRLSELHHLMGDIPAALASARRSASLAPGDEKVREHVGALERLVQSPI